MRYGGILLLLYYYNTPEEPLIESSRLLLPSRRRCASEKMRQKTKTTKTSVFTVDFFIPVQCNLQQQSVKMAVLFAGRPRCLLYSSWIRSRAERFVLILLRILWPFIKTTIILLYLFISLYKNPPSVSALNG